MPKLTQATLATRLSAVFAEVADAAVKTEDQAAKILAIVKSGGIRSSKEFDAAVREAYAQNGWNLGVGRPREGTNAKPVPQTVKSYVSHVRAALVAGLRVTTFRSFYALRKAVRAKRDKAGARAQKRTPPAVRGLRLIQGDVLTGAPFHDLAVLYENLERGKRSELEAAVNRLVKQYRPAADLELLKAA